MEEFITKVLILKGVLAATGETLKELEVVLITLGALSDEYESFITSITTRYDPTMTFASLCELLMDQEIRIQKNQLVNLLSINVAVKSYLKKADSPDSGSSSSRFDIRC